MDNIPYFSLIVPMYNAETCIKTCIDSILAQDFKDFEIIIVDDASIDNSFNICRKLYDGNEKVRLFRQEKNFGAGLARNIGIKNARGKYLWFINSDDAIMPDALEKIFHAAQNNDSPDAIHFKEWYVANSQNITDFDPEKTKLLDEFNKNEGFLVEDIPRRLTENWIENKIADFIGVICVRKDFLTENNIEFWDCCGEDKIFNLVVMCLAKKYMMIRDSVFIKRIGSKSADITEVIASMPKISIRMEKFLNQIPALEGNKTLKEACIAQILETLSTNYVRPLYNSFKINIAADTMVNNALSPIFGENIVLVKFLFRNYNTLCRLKQQFTKDILSLNNRVYNADPLIAEYINSTANLERLFDRLDEKDAEFNEQFIEKIRHMNYAYFENLSYCMPPAVYDKLLDRVFAATIKEIRQKEKIKLAFVANNAALWCGDELYDIFAENDRYEVTFFLGEDASKKNSPLIHKDFLDSANQLKQNKPGINLITIDNFAEEPIEKQDVLIWLKPYVESYPPPLQLDKINADTLLASIPYGFDTAGWDSACNIHLYRVLWKNFFETKFHMELRERNSDISVRGFYSGYPRLDIFFKGREKLKFDWKMTRPDAIKIIYAPHWSIGNKGVRYSTFRYNYKFFYEYAKNHQETSWVIKPHPNLLFTAVRSHLFPSEEAFEEYLQAWDDLPNAKVVTGGYYHSIFETSDGMILDSASFISEYQYTHNPMIFLTRDSQKFNELGNELMKSLYRVDGMDLDGIEKMMQKIFIEGNDELYDARKEFFDKYFDYTKANGGMTAAEYIFKNISQELTPPQIDK